MDSARTEVARARANRPAGVRRAMTARLAPVGRVGRRKTVLLAVVGILARPVTVLRLATVPPGAIALLDVTVLRLVTVLPVVMVRRDATAPRGPVVRGVRGETASVAMTAAVHPDPVHPMVPDTIVPPATRSARARSAAGVTASRSRIATPTASRPCAIGTTTPRSRMT